MEQLSLPLPDYLDGDKSAPLMSQHWQDTIVNSNMIFNHSGPLACML